MKTKKQGKETQRERERERERDCDERSACMYPPTKGRRERERERERGSWVVTATFGFMAMGHTNRLILEANSEHP
jgi:hypothetical protein